MKLSNMNEKFNIFIGKLDFAYRQFLLWKHFQNSKYNKIYENSPETFNAIFQSLLTGFLIELAKLTENGNVKFEEVVSIYSLLEEELEPVKETIKKIKNLRNKVLSHNDKNTLKDVKKFMRDLKLKNSDIEDLFVFLIEWLDENKKRFKNSTEFKNNYFKEVAGLIEKDIESFLTILEENI